VIVPFDTFSSLVDEVLEDFRAMLDTNTKVNAYVEGETTE
jgi:hypothetical protein